MTAAIGGVGAVGSGVSAVYALSPFLNGVVRTTDAAAVQAAPPPAAPSATQTAAPATPFVNPAFTAIADAFALRQTIPQAPPGAAVLSGDAGELVQAYGAVALLTGPLAVTAAYGVPQQPLVPAVAPTAAAPRLARIETPA